MAERATIVNGDSVEYTSASAFPITLYNSSGTETGTTSNPLSVDANRVLSKAITFLVGTTGAVANTTLFTVTGDVVVRVFGICTDLLDETGATATIEVGVTNLTAGIIAQVNATAIDANEIWHDGTPDAIVDTYPAQKVVPNGLDIIQKIAGNTVKQGLLTYYCVWEPLSSGATVVAA